MASTTATRRRSSYVLARAEVRAVERVSPSFARITFGGPGLDEFATPGEVLDARIKVVFPPASGILPPLDDAEDDWWGAYQAVPEQERGAMRTYSIRDLRVTDAGTEVVVDFVLHLEPGLTGPASRWASTAAPGREVFLVGPRRGAAPEEHGGIEYAPRGARSVVLVGDETAAPAIARVLEDAPRETRGMAFIEVPVAEDVLPIDAPEGVEVHWLPRGGVEHGRRLIPTVIDCLGGSVGGDFVITDVDGESLAWETPVYSRTGEELDGSDAAGERYFWIAGESGVVTTLRRHLVKDIGVDRGQVAFMGYWRRGVAMRG